MVRHAGKRRVRRVRSKATRSNKVSLRGRFANKVQGIVQKMMRQGVETKQAYLTQTPIDFNSGITVTPDALQVIPNISNGTGDNSRIGDQLSPQNLSIRGIVQMLPQGANATYYDRKIAVRMMLITPKSYGNWTSASANCTTWMPALLKKGGTTVGFTGDISDLYAPINTDAITCHKQKIFYFNQTAFPNGTINASMDQSHLVRFFKWNIKFGKTRKFKYDANIGSGLTPSNAGYIIVLGYVFVDGTAPDTIATRIRLQYDSVLNYEDA